MTKIRIEKIERETDKALFIATEIDTAAGLRGIKIWLPKSQVRIDGDIAEVPDWLAAAKLREWAEYRGIPAHAVYCFNA